MYYLFQVLAVNVKSLIVVLTTELVKVMSNYVPAVSIDQKTIPETT
jgi:hypothetical protein